MHLGLPLYILHVFKSTILEALSTGWVRYRRLLTILKIPHPLPSAVLWSWLGRVEMLLGVPWSQKKYPWEGVQQKHPASQKQPQGEETAWQAYMISNDTESDDCHGAHPVVDALEAEKALKTRLDAVTQPISYSILVCVACIGAAGRFK